MSDPLFRMPLSVKPSGIYIEDADGDTIARVNTEAQAQAL